MASNTTQSAADQRALRTFCVMDGLGHLGADRIRHDVTQGQCAGICPA